MLEWIFLFNDNFIGNLVGFALSFFGVKLLLTLLQNLGFFIIVNEGFAKIITLFGNVEAQLTEPGFHFLWSSMGWKSLLFVFSRTYEVDVRRQQNYLRSLGVNSEEGAPMGIGVWYEMKVNDPVKYLFENADPEGSLKASVSNATIRSLGNLPLVRMLTERHTMSNLVRKDVSSESSQWGFELGSVYIRKVHFKDHEMIRQIEGKVVNRLRQVTSALNQDGQNRVKIITSTADKQAAVEFAKAQAIRIQTIGNSLKGISQMGSVKEALVQVLETQRILESQAQVHCLEKSDGIFNRLIAAEVVDKFI